VAGWPELAPQAVGGKQDALPVEQDGEGLGASTDAMQGAGMVRPSGEVPHPHRGLAGASRVRHHGEGRAEGRGSGQDGRVVGVEAEDQGAGGPEVLDPYGSPDAEPRPLSGVIPDEGAGEELDAVAREVRHHDGGLVIPAGAAPQRVARDGLDDGETVAVGDRGRDRLLQKQDPGQHPDRQLLVTAAAIASDACCTIGVRRSSPSDFALRLSSFSTSTVPSDDSSRYLRVSSSLLCTAVA
jgi:hypothetical protein